MDSVNNKEIICLHGARGRVDLFAFVLILNMMLWKFDGKKFQF